jgi:hypothetical protein
MVAANGCGPHHWPSPCLISLELGAVLAPSERKVLPDICQELRCLEKLQGGNRRLPWCDFPIWSFVSCVPLGGGQEILLWIIHRPPQGGNTLPLLNKDGYMGLIVLLQRSSRSSEFWKAVTNPSSNSETKIKSQVIFLIQQTNVWIICEIIYKAALSYSILMKGSWKKLSSYNYYKVWFIFKNWKWLSSVF